MTSPLYIPSRKRWLDAPTIKETLEQGMQPMVVVPQEEVGAYRVAFPTATVIGTAAHGIGPTRQFILEHARASGAERFWMLDDDLDDPRTREHFMAPYTFLPWPDWLAAIEDLTNDPRIGAATGMTRQYGWPEDSAIPNKRVGYAILMRTAMPVTYWPFLHEDTDMTLQILRAGFRTIKLPQFVFHTTTMGWRGGGCGQDYEAGADERAGDVLLRKWEAIVPGLVRLTKNKEGKTVTRIKWSVFRQEGTFS